MSDFVIENGILKKYNGTEAIVQIPEGIISIGSDAFRCCNSLVEIILPEGITSIENESFKFCNNLKKIVLPEGVTAIGKEAFSGCSSLEDIRLPESISVIERGAFAWCKSLVKINLPECITSIEDWLFSCCSSLVEITLPSSLTMIGEYAFSDCSSLEKIHLPESLTSIDRWAFSDCSSLMEIIIPEAVTYIGRLAFSNCSNLKIILKTTATNAITNFEDVLERKIIETRSYSIPIPEFYGTQAQKSVLLGYVRGMQEGETFSQDVMEENNKYIKFQRKKWVEFAIKEEIVLEFMLNEKMFKLKEIPYLIEKVNETGNTELAAILLQYREKKFSEEEKQQFAQTQFQL